MLLHMYRIMRIKYIRGSQIIFLLSAQYRLDYSIMKQPGECPSSDK